MAKVHFHFRLGPNDAAPLAPDGNEVLFEVPLRPNQHDLGHGLHGALQSLARMGLAPSELGIDFLILGTAVITADKHVSRQSQAEDSWTRQLAVGVPVSDPNAWTAVAPRLAEALGFLTGDMWSFAFRPRPAEFATLAHGYRPAAVNVDYISLFSGGLDSFIGAIDLLAAGRSVMFVSHSAVRTDSSRQRQLVDALTKKFGAPLMHMRGSILVERPHLAGAGIENSQRSRSFLFFALAVLAASALPRVDTIVVPENGLISLNIPLEDLRLGSLSTRTTHPYFLARMGEILRALGFGARLVNPYQFLTKGEMVRQCRDTAFLAAELSNTISCSSPNSSRIRLGKEQCGFCIPCLIRRAALFNNVLADSTTYGLSDLKERPLRTDQKEGEHVRAFQTAILRLRDDPFRARMIVHESGPLSDYPDRYDDFSEIYRRGLREVGALLEDVVTEPHG